MKEIPIYPQQLERYIQKSQNWRRMIDEANVQVNMSVSDLKTNYNLYKHVEGIITRHFNVISKASSTYIREENLSLDIESSQKYFIHSLHREDSFLSLVYNQRGFFLVKNENEKKRYSVNDIRLIYIPLFSFHELIIDVKKRSIDFEYLNQSWGYSSGKQEVYDQFINEINKIKERLYVPLVEKFQ